MPLTFELVRWTLLRVREDGDRHVLGYRTSHARGRTSSPIQSFDRTTATATTLSGNHYRLVGDPCAAGFDDELVLIWLARHDVARRHFEIIGTDDL